MKNKLLIGLLALTFCSCSLMQRHDEEEEAEKEEASESSPAANSADSEIARLNTKIAALETKLDVLSSNMERIEMKKSQPIIEADPSPQPHMAAPVDMQESNPPQVSAAPSRPQELPTNVKSTAPKVSTEVEKEFRQNMALFQNGKNAEAASGFALIAKKNPQHLLASHALYWAGEASARNQQWSVALDNWSDLEKTYPRSAYLPEALAGLSRAYEKQGNTGKAMAYRDTLMRAFPKSPVALNFTSSARSSEHEQTTKEETPAYEEEKESTESE